MDSAIECRGVHRSFVSRNLVGKRKETIALTGLDLMIPRGIVFGLLGPNGSGKTTTVRILSTLLTPSGGQAQVLGFDVVKEASKVRTKIGLILGGDRGLYGRLTGMENLAYYAALSHLHRKLAKKRVRETIELVGLADAAHRPVEQYSRGMKQRLHIARGLITEPEMLFMDEPTIGLDPAGAQDLRQLIPKLIQTGKTILLTTHYMSEADELCQQISIINKGRITVSGTPSEIKRNFSKIAIIEIIHRQISTNSIDNLSSIEGIQRVIANSDGPLNRLTIHTLPGAMVESKIKDSLGKAHIESYVQRDPTLEEAYLSIVK